MVLEVVREQCADRPLDDPFGEDLPQLLGEESGGDQLGRVGVDGNGLALWVDPLGEVPPGAGVIPLEGPQGKIASFAQLAAGVLAEVGAALELRSRGVVEEKPRLASLSGDPESCSWGRIVENVLLGLGRAEGGNPGFGELHFHGFRPCEESARRYYIGTKTGQQARDAVRCHWTP